MTVAQGTPRTDAEEIDRSELSDWGTGPSGYVRARFARLLEREVVERDEHIERLTGMKFSDRMHAALLSRAETAEAENAALSAQVVELQQRAEAAERKVAELQHIIESARTAHVEVYGRRFSGVGGKLFPDEPAED